MKRFVHILEIAALLAVVTPMAAADPKTPAPVSDGARNPAEWSFRNQVIPILTKVGCNSGACHGALAGKGGLKLSLRGYDPDADYFVLTRQALGRRIDKMEPTRSLFLLKPTMASLDDKPISHGG